MKKVLIIISLFLCMQTSFAKVFYFSAGVNLQMSLESLFLFNRDTGTVLDNWLSMRLFSILKDFKNRAMPRFNVLVKSATTIYKSYLENYDAIVNMPHRLKALQIADIFEINLSYLKDVRSILANAHELRETFLKLSKLDVGTLIERLDGTSGIGIKKFLAQLGETSKHAVELKEMVFDQLDEFGVGSTDDFFKLLDEISNPRSVLNNAFRKKLSPLFSTGVQGYFQVGMPIVSSDFYFGFELGFGMNLGRMIAPNIGFLRDSSSATFGFGVMPRLFLKYDIYYLATTLFAGFGDKSLVLDPVYVGNLIGEDKITNPFNVIETGFRLRLAFLNLETSVLFSVSDFKYRDLRFGLGFEIPVII
ncbi:hypothetical protein DB313_02830 [Borrelia turcica IST7]|uniref:Uncharacterized protein n=1 Tax=Borrelia turcica IST7 TaxID=1104446 RepID=A0A386PMU1_9SPIR|nr:hypothetical protein [Borrelia turcica]AYE36405.1 hypothetical protein DB313_02830 [Borrelia turcica IST7]